MTSDKPGQPGPPPAPPGTRTAGTFRSLMEAFETLRVPLAGGKARTEAARHGADVKALIDRQFPDAQWRHLMERAHAAAVRGEHEFLLLRVPAAGCTDHGRAILREESTWPETLTGDAASAYRRWREELQPQGFGLEARVIDFSGGLPGDVGLFLGWRK